MADNSISGYALRFNDIEQISSYHRERLAPGCVTRYFRDDCLALIGHDHDRVLGRLSAGTLQLRQDRIGLWFSCDLDMSTPDGQTAWGTVSRQDVKGCSFSFHVLAEEWQEGGQDELPLRTITELELIEVTITSIPAYPATMVDVVRTDNQSAALRRIREKAERAHRLRGIR